MAERSRSGQNKASCDLHPTACLSYHPAHGQVAEWSKAHAWKVCRRETVYPGFESLSLRHNEF